MNSKKFPAVFSLVYLSRCSASFLAADEEQRKKALTAVQTAKGVKAKQTGINGVLLVAEGYFIGWLEGDEAAITARAALLTRSFFHTDIQIIYAGMGPARLDRWTMALVSRTDAHGSLAKQIAALQAGSLPRLPRTRGSMPASMLRSIFEDEPVRDKRRLMRIGLVGQTGVWSSALISHLSGVWAAPVTHTRVVGGPGFGREAIIDYLNAEHPVLGRIRVVNLAGDVPSLSWMRAIEEKMSACVLFYSVSDEQAFKSFSTVCMNHLGSYGRFMPVLCLFGRSAAALMDPVQDLFVQAGREISVSQVSLADSAAVWRVIEAGLPNVQSGSSTYGVWGASSQLQGEAATAPAEAPKPLLEFNFSETLEVPSHAASIAAPEAVPVAQPVAAVSLAASAPMPVPAHDLDFALSPVAVPVDTPRPLAPPLVPAALSPVGQQLLATLLEIDAVVAVGAQWGQNGATAVLCGHETGQSEAQTQSLELAFRAALNDETDHHAALSRLHPDGDKRNQKILARWADRFTFSFDVRGAELCVVLLHMAKGYNNESLVRAAVRASLKELREPVFERL